jgi:hypothetical protein
MKCTPAHLFIFGASCSLQPPVLRRCRQLQSAVLAHRAEQAARDADNARRAAQGVFSKTAHAAASLVGSVASVMMPGVGSNASSPAEPPQSQQLLQEAGVPVDTEDGDAADSSNTGQRWVWVRGG